MSYKKHWDKLIYVYGEYCFYCRIEKATEIDHVVPYSWDQDNSIQNIVPSCGVCNRLAGNMMFDDVWHKRAYILDRRKDRGYRMPEITDQESIESTCDLIPKNAPMPLISDLTAWEDDGDPTIEDYTEKILRLGNYDDCAEMIKQVYGMGRFTYNDFEIALGINRYYLWKIVNTPGFDPPDWVKGLLKIEQKTEIRKPCERCGQVHRSVKTCGASRSDPGRRMIENPTIGDLRAAYIGVLNRNKRAN